MITPGDRLQGTLDLLILRVLRQESTHGWGIAQQIQQISRDVLQVNQGSLYPALRRLEERGWITAAWGTSDNNRRARYYKLTAAGRKRLTDETASWQEFVLAVSRVLHTA
ncbi:MAG: PadR family transcriptional regulator [Gemmatimonadaceae bacterium]